MSRYIERKVVINKVNEIPAHFNSGDIRYGIEIAIQAIKDTPTADVAEVVRCKDCKHLMFSDMYGVCSQAHMRFVRLKDFCSYGERKGGD